MPSNFTPQELQEREDLAYKLLSAPFQRPMEAVTPEALLLAGVPGRPAHLPPINFPPGAEPTPQAKPGAHDPSAKLPRADVVVITYTQAEAAALCDVLTPGVDYTDWYHYSRLYASKYKPELGPRSNALKSSRLGSYYQTRVGQKNVLVMKSELHLARDPLLLPDNTMSLPIRHLFGQIIDEAKPTHFITTGTAGGVSCGNHLGDVAVARSGVFNCFKAYKNAPFNGKSYASKNWNIPGAQLPTARTIMQGFAGELSGKGAPPAGNCGCDAPGPPPALLLGNSGGVPDSVITTDIFEFGTSTNGLGALGSSVEMDDAVLGLVCKEDVNNPPFWGSVRNLSDPCINGALDNQTQIKCATFYYAAYGYWTSVMSAVACWGIIAGL